MATRSNIVIKSGKQKTYLYHHYDGYPEGVGADLQQFLEGRGNKAMDADDIQKSILDGIKGNLGRDYEGGIDKKYEKTTGIHGDVEYVYTIDTDKGTLSYKEWDWNTEKWKKPVKMYQGTPSTANSSLNKQNINKPQNGNGGTSSKANNKG